MSTQEERSKEFVALMEVIRAHIEQTPSLQGLNIKKLELTSEALGGQICYDANGFPYWYDGDPCPDC